MLTLTPILNDTLATPLYQQLFSYIRDAILSNDIHAGNKLPSLRALSKSLNLSLTTVQLAYEQLAVEGYIQSRPQSGYYVNNILQGNHADAFLSGLKADSCEVPEDINFNTKEVLPYADPACFDFTKWKKCMNQILNEHSDLLLQEGDPGGEPPLRREISKYIYQARGARCRWQQVVIGAGTQQLISLLCIILQRMGIDHVSFEEPGYIPVRGIFRDRGIQSTGIPVDKDGIKIERLPTNIRSTAYVSPSNQFPTGSIMPAARRYALLDWAAANNSVIIEDDYNSELRYSGRPVPSLQGLDNKDLVVYLGSFSSTLFSSVKISFMVLPIPMLLLFESILGGYTQTCSKTEQLTLALYMENGMYQIHLKKLRKLYAQKIQVATAALERHAGKRIKIMNNSSGLHMLLELSSLLPDQGTDAIIASASSAGLTLAPVFVYPEALGAPMIIFYYTRVPLNRMDEAVQALLQAIEREERKK